MTAKKFTLQISCYGKYLSGVENADENGIRSFIENHNEPLPEDDIIKALTELKTGEELKDYNWQINKEKLLGMIPENHREIKLKRLS